MVKNIHYLKALFTCIALTFFISCSKDIELTSEEPAKPAPVPPTIPTIPLPSPEYNYTAIGNMIVAVKKNMDTLSIYTEGINKIKIDITELGQIIPEHITAQWKKDTIWIEAGTQDISYEKSSSMQHISGKVIISNPTSYLEKSSTIQPAILLHYLALLHYDKYLTENSRNSLKSHYNEFKSKKYSRVYTTNGIKLIRNQIPDASNNVETFFAELTEAYFLYNDYYPFDYQDLERYDNTAFNLMVSIFGKRIIPANPLGITLPPKILKQWLEYKENDLDLYYSKYINAGGMPIVASRFVADSAIIQAKYIIEKMLQRVPDALQVMLSNKFRVGIIGANEDVTDMPENRKMNEWWPGTDWNTRARGYGATAFLPLMSCGEENIIQIPNYDEWYSTQSIMVHEFAHNIDFGLRKSRNGFEKKIIDAYNNAIAKKLWDNTYAITNDLEYFATGAQAWYDTGNMYVRINKLTDRLKTREQLKLYDRELYDILSEVFTEEKLKGYHFTYE